MKILFGMPAKDSWGGPIASEPPFVEAVRKMGIDATDEVYVYGDKDKPTPIFERIRRVWETAFRFRRILKDRNFDIVHLNTAFDLKTILRDSFSLFVMRPKRTKVFLKLHGSEAENFRDANFLIRFLINYLENRVDGFGVFTTEERGNFLRLGFAPEKLFFVKNAVTIGENLPAAFVREQKESDAQFNLLFVSRFIPAKGLLETIRACSILKEKKFRFNLHCIGDGEIRSEAESESKKSGLQTEVKFTGYISEAEVSEYFFGDNIFIFPTRHAEGFPIVLFKAAAVGMPIVTTKIRAAADYFRENENCLFATQKPTDIAEKIIKLIEDKNLRETMSRENLAFGKTLLPDNIAKEYLKIYWDILDKK